MQSFSFLVFPTSIEKYICGLLNDSGRVNLADICVVEVIPPLIDGVLAKGGVVTSIEASKVIADCVEVINYGLVALRIDYVLAQV